MQCQSSHVKAEGPSTSNRHSLDDVRKQDTMHQHVRELDYWAHWRGTAWLGFSNVAIRGT